MSRASKKVLFKKNNAQKSGPKSQTGRHADAPDAITGKFRRAYERLVRGRGTPNQIASGFALGIFIGFFPIVFQMLLAVVCAAMLKWSKLAAATGVMITNPVTAPFIYSLTYLVGARLAGFQMSFDLNMLSDLPAFIEMVRQTPRIFIALMTGGIILGAPTAVISYFPAYKAADKYQKDLKAKIARQKERLKERVKQKKEIWQPFEKEAGKTIIRNLFFYAK